MWYTRFPHKFLNISYLHIVIIAVWQGIKYFKRPQFIFQIFIFYTKIRIYLAKYNTKVKISYRWIIMWYTRFPHKSLNILYFRILTTL